MARRKDCARAAIPGPFCERAVSVTRCQPSCAAGTTEECERSSYSATTWLGAKSPESGPLVTRFVVNSSATSTTVSTRRPTWQRRIALADRFEIRQPVVARNIG